MTPRDFALKQLLSGELPLDAVGPHLRQAARRAVLSGDQGRMALVARVVVTELLRRGDLLRVAVHSEDQPVGTYCLLRGTRNLVDVSCLDGDPQGLPAADSRSDSAAPLPPAPEPAYDPRDVADLIGVMEDAQDLEIGAPQSGEPGVILAGILGLLARYTPQVRIFIMLHEEVEVPEASRGVFVADPDEIRQGWPAVRKSGESVWIPTPGELPPHIRDFDAGGPLAPSGDPPFPFVSAAAVPLREPASGGESGEGPEAGLLFVVTSEEWTREAVLRLAKRLSRFVSRRWQHQREVNQKIHMDSLTGVFNRAYFDGQFTLELERARRSQVPLTLVIADLDHFKSVNDEHGHHVGDRVLKMVARRLQEELRRIDHICRIGGEEFALILPDTSEDSARDVMRRLLEAPFITEAVIDGESRPVRVTFSTGAVTFPDAGADAFELYRKADAMLYLSKDAGRNRCHFWNSSGDHLELKPGSSDRD